VTFSLPIPPSVNAMYVNVAGVGRVKTTTCKQWYAEAKTEIMMQRRDIPEVADKATVHYVVPYNGRRDLDNYLKALNDVLVSSGVLPSDRMSCLTGVAIKVGDVDRVEVTVTPA
tara:strand:+ start:372 stop:713 length:342 start_codon:yes stop_codon:yes gene_type:complete